MQYLVLLWAVNADILSGTIVTNLRIKVMGVNVID